MTTKERIEGEIRKYRGTIVIDCILRLVRLDGMEEDEVDYYYVYTDIEGKTVPASAVGWFIPLKDVLPDKDYDYIESVFNHSLEMIEYRKKWNDLQGVDSEV